MINLKEIARIANVDLSTVSRALNDSPRVKKSTKERIKAIALQLDYVPNEIARGLSNKKTNTVGVLLPEFINTFYAELIEGLESVFSHHGYSILFGKTNFDCTTEISLFNTFRGKRTDGIIICSCSPETVEFLRENGNDIPMVLVDTFSDDDDFYSVNIDTDYGIHSIVEYCLALGHRDFGFIGDRVVTKRRLITYKQALMNHGIVLDSNHIHVGVERYERGGYLRMKELLSGQHIPTVVFAETDNLAIGAMSAAMELSVRIPDDISIIGFDDITASSFMGIPLTTIVQPKKEMGNRAAGLLIDLIERRAIEGPMKTVLKPELVIRSSSSHPRVT